MHFLNVVCLTYRHKDSLGMDTLDKTWFSSWVERQKDLHLFDVKIYPTLCDQFMNCAPVAIIMKSNNHNS